MNAWVEAARPKTLPAAITPVLVGTSAANEFIAWRFVGALLVAVAIQVGVNYGNDYFDGTRGVDTAARVGPRRAVAAGLVAPEQMKIAIGVAFAVAATAGLLLAVAVGYELLVVGVLCFVAALAYSGGPRPYASLGLGELFVFVFFGLVATIGSAYVQDESIVKAAVLASVPVGLLAAAILVVNNLRDIDSDAQAGKKTLAVRLGARRTCTLFRVLVLGAYPWLPLIAGVIDSPGPLLPFATLPLVRVLDKQVTGDDPASRMRALPGSARLELAFGVLLAVGLLV